MSRRRLPIVAPSVLPPLYAAWMDELLDGPVPPEEEATCDDCAMVPAQGERAGDHAFDPSVKCCTYVPDIPNFLVGRILRDRDLTAKAGRLSVERRIDDKIAVSPLGLTMPAPYKAVYAHATKHDAFGREPALRCPHYVEGPNHNCGIWMNRTSVCSTWFCKHVRGAVGRDFWTTGVLPLLGAIERALSRHCILEIGCDDSVLGRLFASSGPDDRQRGAELRSDPESHARDWGRWLGKERAFYEQCARLVDAMKWKDVVAISGVDVRVRARVTRDLHAQLVASELPERLRAGSFETVDFSPGKTRVSTYCSYDPIDLPAQLMALLPQFDGRPTQKIVAEIARTEGVDLEHDLLRRLVDFEILVSASATKRITPKRPAR